MCYGFDLILHFKNLTNIYPSKALIYKLQMWDNSSDVRNTKGNIIMFDFLNSNMEYTTAKIATGICESSGYTRNVISMPQIFKHIACRINKTTTKHPNTR